MSRGWKMEIGPNTPLWRARMIMQFAAATAPTLQVEGGMGEHEAGRELDALIAEKVMGWTVKWAGGHVNATTLPAYLDDVDADADHWDGWVSVPPYSTDITAAWGVAEKLRADGWDFWLTLFAEGDVQAQFDLGDRCGEELTSTAPLAICRAALKAVRA